MKLKPYTILQNLSVNTFLTTDFSKVAFLPQVLIGDFRKPKSNKSSQILFFTDVRRSGDLPVRIKGGKEFSSLQYG